MASKMNLDYRQYTGVSGDHHKALQARQAKRNTGGRKVEVVDSKAAQNAPQQAPTLLGRVANMFGFGSQTKQQPLDQRQIDLKTVQETYLTPPDRQAQLLGCVLHALTDEHSVRANHLENAVLHLVDPDLPYVSLLKTLGVTDKVIKQVRKKKGDLKALPEADRNTVLKAILVLAFETNALKSISSGDSTSPALARAIYFAILDSGLEGVQSVVRAVEDQELAGQVFAELLGIDDYRAKLSDAIKAAVGLAGVKATPVKGKSEDVRTAMGTMLNGLYAHFQTRLAHEDSLPKGVLPLSQVKTIDEKINGLLAMGVSFHSIVLMQALLAKVKRNEMVLGQLRMSNPLLRDMLTPVREEDEGVEFAACRRFHLSRIHDAGSIGGNHGSDDAIRVAAYLCLTENTIDGNRLVETVIKLSQSADADTSVTKLLEAFEDQDLVARTDDGMLAPNGDLNELEGDFIGVLCSTLKDAEDVLVLYRAFMAIGLEELPKKPKAKSERDYRKCILEARAIASTMETIVSGECQEQMFQLMLPHRNTDGTLHRPACNKLPVESESSDQVETEAANNAASAQAGDKQADAKTTDNNVETPADGNSSASEEPNASEAKESEDDGVLLEATQQAENQIADLEQAVKQQSADEQGSNGEVESDANGAVAVSEAVVDSGDENEDADSVVSETELFEQALEEMNHEQQEFDVSNGEDAEKIDQEVSHQTQAAIDRMEAQVKEQLAQQKKLLEAKHAQEVAQLKKEQKVAELRQRISALKAQAGDKAPSVIALEESLEKYVAANQVSRKRPHSGSVPVAKRPEKASKDEDQFSVYASDSDDTL